MSANLDWMILERAAAPPRPHYNPVRHYEADITARRLEAGYAEEVAARQRCASTCIDVRLEVD